MLPLVILITFLPLTTTFAAEGVPFLVEDMLKQNSGKYSKQGDWAHHVVTQCLLITGQNPASSEPAAKTLQAKLT